MSKIGLLLCGLLILTGCAQVEGLAVGPDDNGFACLKGNTSATAALVGGRIDGVRVELPASVDTSTWTAEDFRALAEICD